MWFSEFVVAGVSVNKFTEKTARLLFADLVLFAAS